ncbi:hypothetical protein [Mesoplasma melaleucae]|uniref:hypothetical protein n=1 Tax=Mesoplasma melaleucae TaxID=81459 RepID=UPI0004864D97|nr:hypothetical protein [Mesoplasma melaleucae]
MKDVKVPNYKDLIKLAIKTNLDLKVYFSYQLTLFVANLFGIEVKKAFDFKEQHDDINLDYYKYNSNIWKKIMTKLNNKESKPQIAFTSESLGLLMNALFEINWYIQNFTTDDYNLDSKEMLDDNYIFSKDKTDLEIIKEVNAKIIDESIINATNIDALLEFFYDLFSGETDKNSYKLLRTFKILFQVDDDITTGNTNLSFNKKILKINKTTLSLNLVIDQQMEKLRMVNWIHS